MKAIFGKKKPVLKLFQGLSTLDRQALRRFFSAFLRYKKLIYISLAMIPFSAVASLGMPWLLIQIVDKHIVQRNFTTLYWMVGTYIGLFLLSVVTDIFYSYSLQKVGTVTLNEVRRKLFAHVLLLPKSHFDNSSQGSLITAIITGFETIGDSLVMGVFSLIVDLVKTILLCAFLFWLNWKLALLVSTLFPLLIWFTYEVRKRLRKSYDKARIALSDSISYLSECLQGMKTLLLSNSKAYAYYRYNIKSRNFLTPQKVANVYEAVLFSFFEAASILSIVLVLLLGSLQIEVLTIGGLIVFYQVLQQIFIPMREFAQQFSTIQRAISAMVGAEKLFQVPIDPSLEIKKGPFKPQTFVSIEAKNLSFQYRKDQPYVLRSINFSIQEKERVALVGRTGSGKSTIIKLLTKQYGHYEGSLTINGKEVRDMKKNDVMSYLSVMGQETYLFHGSLEDNVGLYNPIISKDDVKKACDFVQLVLEDEKGGKAAEIAEGGKNISIGQAQMTGLARAIALDRPVFVLDEATASIDSITEAHIQNALKKIFEQKTILAIAHRLSTIRNSDRIYCLKNGQIVESGTHDQLLAKKGYYYELLHFSDEEFLSKSPAA